ncbi:MAG TPA: hypothetical protein VKQ30_23285 [Ktedonobacterales bacterium]|nr:hypothetical protein [Ktedonobacterales bacterium]
MADVETAILKYWQPGRYMSWIAKIPNPPRGGPYTREMTDERVAWERWERRNHDVVRLTLIAMAHYATVMNAEQGMTFLAVATIAGLADRSVRRMQQILRQMELAHEIEHQACDGTCGFSHGQTHHWIIPRPPDCPLSEWGSYRPPRSRRRRKTH